MNIPEEAVEAAARKIFEYDAPSHAPEEWELLNKWAKFDYRASARAALEAAAPLLMAQAWDEGFTDGRRQEGEGEDGPRYVNPYRP